MNTLADEGFVLLAGPLAGTEQGSLRALLIVNAESEAEIHRRLADDPWTLAQKLEIASIESWNILVGAERLTSAATARGHIRHRSVAAAMAIPRSAAAIGSWTGVPSLAGPRPTANHRAHNAKAKAAALR